MRRGFSMITAIIFIVLVATLGALALSLSTQTTKQTTDLFLREQGELLAQSATEFALLAFSAHEINATNGCLQQINAQYPQAGANALFDINITLRYLGSGLPAACNETSVTTTDSNLTLIIDTIVTSTVSTEPIRFHRRTLQKP
ncbi:MAG: type II secretion system protein [Campylobacterales bacterium]|nr:type II secretion system protein [Campylobacterales bacterium]